MVAAGDASFMGASLQDRARQKVGNGLARPSCAAGKTFGRRALKLEFSEQYARAPVVGSNRFCRSDRPGTRHAVLDPAIRDDCGAVGRFSN